MYIKKTQIHLEKRAKKFVQEQTEDSNLCKNTQFVIIPITEYYCSNQKLKNWLKKKKNCGNPQLKVIFIINELFLLWFIFCHVYRYFDVHNKKRFKIF